MNCAPVFQNLLRGLLSALLACAMVPPAAAAEAPPPLRTPAGAVRLEGRCFYDDRGALPGLGVSYFTALHRCKHDRARLESDLAFLAKRGFHYCRVLSMVGYYPAWEGLEIAPVSFQNQDGKPVEAWPDYWEQLRALIDLAHDNHGLRTQITVFADAQLMPQKEARLEHLQRILTEVLPGREHKIMLLEVANEAWQNGFAGEEGTADLREFAQFLNSRTDIPVAITSDHDRSGGGGETAVFKRLYAGGVADLATWHFSRDRRTDEGWRPVYDCRELAALPGFPPVISNEPVGPGSSVDAERDPLRLVMAAAFAWTAGLPAYVFHSEAGVFGKTRFEDTPGIRDFRHILRLLPPDLPDWERNGGKEAEAPFTMFAGGEANRTWAEVPAAPDGCVRNIGGRKGNRFVCVPVGIRPGGLLLEAREALKFTAFDPLTGRAVREAALKQGERITLPAGPGALLIVGRRL